MLWQRRDVVFQLMAGVCGIAAAPFRPAARAYAPAARFGAAGLLVGLCDPRSAAVIGRAYLASYPEEADAAVLCRLLEDCEGASREARCDWLRARIRADFARNNTVRLRGWVLSRAEARACALEAMYAAGDGVPRP